MMNLIILVAFCAYQIIAEAHQEEEAKQWLNDYNRDACRQRKEITDVRWQYATDINELNKQAKLNAELRLQKWYRSVTHNASKYDWRSFKDHDVRRQLKFLSIKGQTVLSDEEVKDYLELKQTMQSKYSTAKICAYQNPHDCEQRLEPEMTRTMAKSRDYDELKWVWEQWRENSGKQIRHEFIRYIDYENRIATRNGFEDGSDFWTFNYETDDFEDVVEELWEELKPFYVQLHAYVRNRLRRVYGEDNIPKDGPIPAHIFGNMWAQSWTNIEDLLVPFPEANALNATLEMKKQAYTPRKMNQMSEDFFRSLGIQAMPRQFWENSVFERIQGREMVCHASAWDFCERNNVRIKMCTDVTMEDLVTVHHEMGHIVYFLEYKDQPYAYKGGANPGFHEAVGDVVALSVATPKHLNKIGLFKEFQNNIKEDLNFLMKMALKKIAFLPFGYLIDAYRWKILKGEIKENELNCKWWELREKYQGIKAPVPRNEGDFDPGAKYHVAGDVPYIRYFVAAILQFDFHRSLCTEAGEYDPNDRNKPLYACDIFQSQEAGKLFSSVLQMGSSRHWSEPMEKMTGRKTMSAAPIREYFKPLEQWLTEENKKTGEHIGWEEDGSYCSPDGYVPVILDSASSTTLRSTSIMVLSFILVFIFA